ncbi:MAG: hypothetical protein WKF84_16290 [Pyrinomonadaceae bacterium]
MTVVNSGDVERAPGRWALTARLRTRRMELSHGDRKQAASRANSTP